jgi:lysine/ornithine N-monooxygenase
MAYKNNRGLNIEFAVRDIEKEKRYKEKHNKNNHQKNVDSLIITKGYKSSIHNIIENIKKQSNHDSDNSEVNVLEELAELHFISKKNPVKMYKENYLHPKGVKYTCNFNSKEINIEIFDIGADKIEYKTFGYK